MTHHRFRVAAAITLAAFSFVLGGCASEASDEEAEEASVVQDSLTKQGGCSMETIRAYQEWCGRVCLNGSLGISYCYPGGGPGYEHIGCACR